MMRVGIEIREGGESGREESHVGACAFLIVLGDRKSYVFFGEEDVVPT